MLEYIYFVKCPGCEDEHFYFFNDAKECAMNQLTKKPIITQTEVNRNDFGECTDSADLGTVWSWEDVVELPATNPDTGHILTLDDLKDYGENDPEFAALDNNLDCGFEEDVEPIAEPAGDLVNVSDNFKKPGSPLIVEEDQVLATNKRGDFMIPASSGYGYTVFNRSNVRIGYIDSKTDEDAIRRFKLGDLDEECKKRPLPEGMTIEQLVEELEANEDTVECACCNELYPKEECHHDEKHGWICPDCEDEAVECTWCEELYDRSECRYEVDLGWLCDGCQQAIASRGEPLTFRENTYWDFLDESIPAELFANCIDHSDMEIWGLEPVQDDIYEAVLLKRFENVSYCGGDETQKVTDEMYDIDGAFTFGFSKDGLPSLHSWNTNLLRKLGSIRINFKDGHYKDAAAKVFSRSADLSEAIDSRELVELEYPSLTVTLYGEKRDVDDWDEVEHTDSYVFLVPKVEVATAIWENWITDEDVVDVEGGFDTLEDDKAWEKFLETHFDILFEKYNKQILEYFREEAEEDFRERSQEEYAMNKWSASTDRAYDAYRDSALLDEAYSPNNTVDFEYNDLEVTLQGPKKDVDDWDELDTIVDYTYTKSAEDVATDIWENFITDYDVKDVLGGMEALEDDAEWQKFLVSHFDNLVDKYYNELLKYYREDARKEYEANHSLGEGCDKPKSFLEELEEPDIYRGRLKPCPECGADVAFDHETGFCINCGFNV